MKRVLLALLLCSAAVPALAEDPFWRDPTATEGGTAPGAAAAAAPSVDYTCAPEAWAGLWYSEYGEVTLNVVPSGIAGTFVYLNGNIAGTLDKTGCVLTGRWDQDPSHKDPSDVGPFSFTLNRDYSSWTGTWGFDGKPDYIDTWSGARSPEAALSLLTGGDEQRI